jgi:hypothetical protein
MFTSYPRAWIRIRYRLEMYFEEKSVKPSIAFNKKKFVGIFV